MANILLTGARAPATLELARHFHKAGHCVFTADSLPVDLCQHSQAVARSFRVAPPRFHPQQFVDDLIHVTERYHIDLIVPTCEEVFYVAQAFPRLSEITRVFTEPRERLRSLHSKWDFNQLAQGMGLSVPETRLLDGRVPYGESVVLKREFTRFAEDVVVLPQHPSDAAHLDVTTGCWLVQDYIPGRQLCTYSVAHNGRVSAHGAYYTQFTAGNGSTIAFEPVHAPAALAWVQAFVANYKYTGQIAFDFIEVADGQVTALECNPRATSGVHLFDERLATAFFDDGSVPMVTPIGERAAVRAAMWAYGWQDAGDLAEWFQMTTQSRDVIWRVDDPLPTWDQLRLLLHFAGARHGRSLIGATTYDIEWNGEP